MNRNRPALWTFTPQLSDRERKIEKRWQEKERARLTAISAAIWDKYRQRLEEVKTLREKIRQFPYRLALDNFTCGEWELKDKILSGLKIEDKPVSDDQCQKMMAEDWRGERKRRQALEKKLDKLVAQLRRKEKR